MQLAPAPFIVGVGRSGTTLLRLMLDANPYLAIPAETHFLIDLLLSQESTITKDQFLYRITHAPTWPNLAVEESVLRNALDELNPFSVWEAIRVFYRLYATRMGKTRWGDKTPPYRQYMTRIQSALPEAYFIHIIRDGRDVALSYRGLWFGPGDDIEAQARFWVGELQAARRQSTELQHYLEVKYEDLVIAPEAGLRRICEYLNLPFHPSMLDYHKSAPARLAEHKRSFGPPEKTPMDMDRFLTIYENTKNPLNPGRIGRWRNEMADADRKRYEAIAGPLLRELGYET